MLRFMRYMRNNAGMITAISGVILMFAWVILPPLQQAFDMYQASDSSSEGAPGSVVVTWKDGKVTERELETMRRAHNIAVQFLRRVVSETMQKGGKPDAPGLQIDQRGFVVDPGIPGSKDDQVLIRTMILAKKARDLGVRVDEAAVKQFISRLSAFTLQEGDWHEIASADLTNQHMSMGQLYTQLETELLAQHMLSLSQTGLFSVNSSGFHLAIPPGQAWDFNNRLHRRLQIAACPVDVAQFTSEVGEPSRAELLALFEEGKDRDPNPAMPEPGFHIPKRIAFSYFRVDFKPFLDAALKTIPENDPRIEAEYQKGISQGKFKVLELEEGTPALPGLPGLPSTEPPKTDGEKPAAEKPADDKPAGEKPAADKPAAEKPADDKPAEEKSADDKPAQEKPKDDKPAAEKKEDASSKIDEPKADEPKANEDKAPEPKAEGTACEDEPKPAEAKPAEVKPDSEKPAKEPEAKPAETKPAETKPAETKPAETKPAETKPAEAKPAETKPGEAPAKEATPATPAKEPKFKPLAEVRDEIRKSLAQPIAEDARRAAVTAAIQAVTDFGHALRRADLNREDDKAAKPAPAPKLDAEAIAAKNKLTAGSTPPVSAIELSELEIGSKAYYLDFQARQYHSLADITFGPQEPVIYQPIELDSTEGEQQFIIWPTEIIPAAAAKFDKVEKQVVAAWKQGKAFEMAKVKAEEKAQQINAGKAKLSELCKGEGLIEPPPFSWFTSGGVAQGMGRVMLSQVPGIELAGRDFMRGVFALQPGQAGIAPNQPHTTVYVVHAISQEPSEELLKAQFLDTGISGEVMQIAQQEAIMTWQEWYSELEKQMGVDWKRPPKTQEESDF